MNIDEKITELKAIAENDIIGRGKVLDDNDFVVIGNRTFLSRKSLSLNFLADAHLIFPDAIIVSTWQNSLYYRDGFRLCIFLNP